MVLPAARTTGLVVEHLAEETLIYDLQRDEAHHLNPTAATVFELCDGTRSRTELATLASERLGQPVSIEMTDEALSQLAVCHLLASGVQLDGGMSRRQVMRKAALVGAGAAVAGPVIQSIVAPTPAQAQSIGCVESGGPCQERAGDCCSGLVCCFPSCESTQTICTAPGTCVAC